MKSIVRVSARACAIAGLSICLMTSTAQADDTTDQVRTAQVRLASLGYYVGRYDGNKGPATKSAIIDFQRANGLATTGQLNRETFSLLQHHNASTNTAYVPGYRSPIAANDYRPSDHDPVFATHAPTYWDSRWDYARSQSLPTRYGRLDVNEEDYGTVRHYVVIFNGHSVLFAHNQPGILRVTSTYKMEDEDAIIFTTYQGDGVCAYKNYLLTIHSDGTFNNPREIGNCNGNFEAHMTNNALYVTFPSINKAHNLSAWDIWRYENNALVRL